MPRLRDLKPRFSSMKEKMKRLGIVKKEVKSLLSRAKEGVSKTKEKLSKLSPERKGALASIVGGMSSFAVAAALAHPLLGMAIAVPMMFGGGIGSLYKEVSRSHSAVQKKAVNIRIPNDAHPFMIMSANEKLKSYQKMLKEATNLGMGPFQRVVGAGVLGGLAYAAVPLGFAPAMVLGAAALGLASSTPLKIWSVKRRINRLVKILTGKERLKEGAVQRHFVELRNPVARVKGKTERSRGMKDLFWGEVEGRAMEGDYHSAAAVLKEVIERGYHRNEANTEHIVGLLKKHPEIYFLLFNRYGPNHKIIQEIHRLLDEKG